MAAALFCQDDFWNFSVGLKAMVYFAVLDSHRRCEEIARTKQTLLKYTQVFDKLAQGALTAPRLTCSLTRGLRF